MSSRVADASDPLGVDPVPRESNADRTSGAPPTAPATGRDRAGSAPFPEPVG